MGKEARNVEEALAMAATALLDSTEGIQVLSDARAALCDWYKRADVAHRAKAVEMDKLLVGLMSERKKLKEERK